MGMEHWGRWWELEVGEHSKPNPGGPFPPKEALRVG